jgi:hypothetical protein
VRFVRVGVRSPPVASNRSCGLPGASTRRPFVAVGPLWHGARHEARTCPSRCASEVPPVQAPSDEPWQGCTRVVDSRRMRRESSGVRRSGRPRVQAPSVFRSAGGTFGSSHRSDCLRPDPGRVRPVPGGPRRKRLGPGEPRRKRLGFRPAGDRLARASPRSSVRGPLSERQAPRSSVRCDPFPRRRKRFSLIGSRLPGVVVVRTPRPLLRAAVRRGVRVQAPDPHWGHRCSEPPGCASAPIGPGAQMLRGAPVTQAPRVHPAACLRYPRREPRARDADPSRGPSAPALRLHPQVSAGSPGGTRTLSTISGSRGPGLRTNPPQPEGSDLARPAPPEALPPVPKAWRIVPSGDYRPSRGPWTGVQSRACAAAGRNPPGTDQRSRESPPPARHRRNRFREAVPRATRLTCGEATDSLRACLRLADSTGV